MRRRNARLVHVFVALVTASASVAQTGTLSGTVMRDTSGHQLAGAEVMLPDLKRGATANWAGEFRIDKVPVGRHAVMVRHLGFAPLVDTIEVTAGGIVDREFVLAEQPATLAEVNVKATQRTYISPALRDFEERRKAGAGYFIAEDEMRKNDERRLVDVIAGHVPGISTFSSKAEGSTQGEYLSSGRKCGPGPVFLSCRGQGAKCPVTLYVDGVPIYDSARDPSYQMPDLARYNTREYAAVEYYPGGASMPVKYNATSSGCGVLLLWTRER